MTGPLTAAEIADTAASIAAVQLPNGMIPWFPGGHADPWNHTEAAMALVLAGRRREADRAFDWLASTQLPDGTWCRYHLAEGIEDPRRDPNVGAYVATGAWWHYLCSGDLGLLEGMWPVVEAAVGFVLRLQQPGGEVLWSMDPDGYLGRYALLTSTSSIHHSLRCAVAIAECLGFERPEWELAADRMVEAIVHRPDSFAPKRRWAMDWYYPVLSGALSGERGVRAPRRAVGGVRARRGRRPLRVGPVLGHGGRDRRVRDGPRRRRPAGASRGAARLDPPSAPRRRQLLDRLCAP